MYFEFAEIGTSNQRVSYVSKCVRDKSINYIHLTLIVFDIQTLIACIIYEK